MRLLGPSRVSNIAGLLLLAILGPSCGGDGGSPSPTPTSVHVTPGADTLFAINATQAFTAEVLDDNGHAVSGAVVSWNSTDTTVVKIDATTGIATARKNGQATIQVHAGALHTFDHRGLLLTPQRPRSGGEPS